jgi:hypothetical protein
MAKQNQEVEVDLNGGQTQPGQFITPGVGQQPAAQQSPQIAAQQPAQPEPPVEPVSAEPVPPTIPEEQAPAPEEDQADYEQPGQRDDAAVSPGRVSWTASEFVEHDKSASWFLGLAAVAAIFSVIMYIVTEDVVSVMVVVVAATIFGIYGSHKPRQLEYKLDQRGLSIGSKYYDLGQFKSFSVVPEGAFSSIEFMPLKRFAPPITIYYDPADEEKIVSLLSNQLPLEPGRRDVVENLMRRIRF